MRQRPPNKWGILFSVIFGIFMVILDATVVNVAFPTLRREFGVGVNESQWVISVYTMALGFAILALSSGSERPAPHPRFGGRVATNGALLLRPRRLDRDADAKIFNHLAQSFVRCIHE